MAWQAIAAAVASAVAEGAKAKDEQDTQALADEKYSNRPPLTDNRAVVEKLLARASGKTEDI